MSCYWINSECWQCGIPAQWPAWQQSPVWPSYSLGASYSFRFTSGSQTLDTSSANTSHIEFDSSAGVSTRDINVDNGDLEFARAGIYKVTYVLELGTPVNTGVAFALALDGTTVPGSGVTTGFNSPDYTGQAIIWVKSGQTLSLAAVFPTGVTSQVVNFASITAVRVTD